MGVGQHKALEAALGGEALLMAKLPQDARDGVQWAFNYIRVLAGGDQVRTEQRVRYVAPDAFAKFGKSTVYFGTADVIILRGNHADLIDYKSGDNSKDHRPQLSGYALALFSMRPRLKTIQCHILYARGRTVDAFPLTIAEAAAIVLPILKAHGDPDRVPSPCDYCSFCVHRATCPALSEKALAVTRNTSDLPTNFDPASITDPSDLAKAVTVARFVSTWAEAVRRNATTLAKEGTPIPGYRLQERRGTREVTDLEEAFSRSCLTPAQFVSACKLSLPKLADAYSAAQGMPKAQAVQEIETMLADLIHEGTPSVSLVVDRR